MEIPNGEFCGRIRRALRDNYGFGDRALTWFTMHESLDSGHGEVFKKYATRAAGDSGGLDRLRAATLGMAPGVQMAWEGFGAWKAV